MDQVQKIREECIKVNPEIGKIGFGDYITGEGVHNGRIIRVIEKHPFLIAVDVLVSGSGVIYKEFDTRNTKIIGRDIRLADVLLVLREKFKLNEVGNQTIKLLELWNLDKNLENQSEECIDFIYKF